MPTPPPTAPSPGRPTPGVVKQDKSSGGSVDTTKTRSDPQRSPGVGWCTPVEHWGCLLQGTEGDPLWGKARVGRGAPQVMGGGMPPQRHTGGATGGAGAAQRGAKGVCGWCRGDTRRACRVGRGGGGGGKVHSGTACARRMPFEANIRHTTNPYHLTPNHATPPQATPHHTTPHHTTPHHTTPHHTTPHHTTPHHTTPHHTTPHRTAPHRTAPRRATPHHATPRHATHRPHRTAPHRTAPHRTTPHHTTPHHTTPRSAAALLQHTTSHHTTLAIIRSTTRQDFPTSGTIILACLMEGLQVDSVSPLPHLCMARLLLTRGGGAFLGPTHPWGGGGFAVER